MWQFLALFRTARAISDRPLTTVKADQYTFANECSIKVFYNTAWKGVQVNTHEGLLHLLQHVHALYTKLC